MNKTNTTRANRAGDDPMITVGHGEKYLIECVCGRMLATWGDIETAFRKRVTTMIFPDCPCGAVMAAQIRSSENWPASAVESLVRITVTNGAHNSEPAQSAKLFALGRTVATAHAIQAAVDAGVELGELVSRHQHGDWGYVHPEDRGLNEAALRDGDRIVSVYQVSSDLTFWVITEWDRSYTTVMLPEEH